MSPFTRRVLALAAAALLLRLLLLWIRGDYIVYDEGYYLLLARSLREGHGFTLNGLPHVALSPLQPLLVAALCRAGVPDLAASRLLAALCGAALVLPVAVLARRWYGDRGGLTAALFCAVYPALLTFLPFFPGRSWNLYFGSEPLYLLLAVAAVLAALRAAEDEHWRWWAAAGALGALAWLTRLEGIVLSASLAAVTVIALARRRRLALWPRALLALAAGTLVGAPYLVYLHGALGRWALSGRVQAAAATSAAATSPPPAASPSGGGSDAVREFVWGGNTEMLWRTLYALDATGTRMASQYWGVPRAAASSETTPPPPVKEGPAPARPPATTEGSAAPSAAGTLARAILVVVPLWVLVLAGAGAARTAPRLDAALWLAPMVVASLVPALLAYPEPRALLLLAPLACILAAGAVEAVREAAVRRGLGRYSALVPAAVALLLAVPSVRDAAGAWHQQTPLQQLATARRVVGEYLGTHLDTGTVLVSWHPALAIYAHRDWRVLPYASFDRIVGYAHAQRAGAIVFSRFEPSPLRDPPRAFTAVLVDSGAAPGADGGVHLEPVASTPALFVGRLAAAAAARSP